MLKVLLVDDEDIIREGIRGIIDWNELGFEVIGEAEDGERALEVMDKTLPDVIITDIKMPFIDGLGLIRIVKEKFPHIYTLIISGYDEFEYAQKAVNLGAYAYVLKPVEPDSLVEVLLKIKNEHELRSKNELEINELKQKVEETQLLSKERIFKGLINGSIEGEEVKKKLEGFKLQAEDVYCAVIIASLDDYSMITADMDKVQKRNLHRELYELVKESINDHKSAVILDSNEYEYIICVWHKYREVLRDTVSAIQSRLRKKVNTIAKYTITIGVGNIQRSILNLDSSYKQAVTALNHKFVLGKNQDIYFKNLKRKDNVDTKLLDFDIDQLKMQIKFNEKDLIEKQIKSLISKIKSKGCDSYLYLQVIISDIFIEALKTVKETGGATDELFADPDPIEAYKTISEYQTAEDKLNKLLSVLLTVSEYIDIKRNRKFDILIEKAKEYIRKNYMDKDLSLEKVASYVNISPCYFSVIFKEQEGKTFIDYLTNVRIEKAKELLRASGYKTYEICDIVGYENSSYFSTLFKRCVGISPTEYRNIHLKK